MKDITWDAYQLFLAVARHGGLSAAAEATGLSAATLGRRMVELEHALGRELFLRSQTGYRLTSDGSQLLEHLLELEVGSRRVEEWRRGKAGQSLVRISLGTWIAWLLCQNMTVIRTPRDEFRIDLHVAEQRARLSHREMISEHIEKIAETSSEQSGALQEVNGAVGRMDQMTQQNAAMVEEATAATQDLSAQTDALRDLLQQFRIEADRQRSVDRAA